MDVFKGFEESYLEKICHYNPSTRANIFSAINWETEIYNHGKTLRKWACYPSILPLFFSCDHGVNWTSIFWTNEKNSSGRDYLTWNKRKLILNQNKFGKRIHYVPHPWVFYRRKKFAKLPKTRKGTLVFFPHTIDNTKVIFKDQDKFFEQLTNLEDKFKPIVLCLSHHDIKKKLHKDLKKYGFPIITLGNSRSREFVDRFYKTLYNFKFATSPTIGSQTFFSIEAGIPYFLLGETPKTIFLKDSIEGEVFMKDILAVTREDVEDYEKLNHILTHIEDEVTNNQKEMVYRYLGLTDPTSRLIGVAVIWYTFIKNVHKLPSFYLKELKAFYKNRKN